MRQAVVAAALSVLVFTGAASAQVAGASANPSFNISAEALLWWFKGNATPPLVTDGLFGGPGTKVFLGDRDADTNRQINPTGAPAITGNPPRTLVGPAQPSFKFNSSDFWAQGLNVGLAYRF